MLVSCETLAKLAKGAAASFKRATRYGLPNTPQARALVDAFDRLQKVEMIDGNDRASITEAAYRAYAIGALTAQDLRLLGGKISVGNRKRVRGDLR